MAYGDFGSLSPAEAYYGGPGGKTDAAKVEATKRASYLSSMDQFYAELDEMERRFDITAELKRDYFDFETGERFDWEKEYGSAELELKGEDIAMRERTSQVGIFAQSEAARYQYDLGLKELEWKEEESERTQSFLESYFRDYGGADVSGANKTSNVPGQSTEDWLLQQSRMKEAEGLGIDFLDLY